MHAMHLIREHDASQVYFFAQTLSYVLYAQCVFSSLYLGFALRESLC